MDVLIKDGGIIGLTGIIGSVEYDNRGRVVKVGDFELGYDEKNRLAQIGGLKVDYDIWSRVVAIDRTTIDYDTQGNILTIKQGALDYEFDRCKVTKINSGGVWIDLIGNRLDVGSTRTVRCRKINISDRIPRSQIQNTLNTILEKIGRLEEKIKRARGKK